MGDNPGLFEWPIVTTRGVIRKSQEGQSQRQGHAMMKTEVEKVI